MRLVVTGFGLIMALAGCAGPLRPDNSVTTTARSKHSSEQTFRNLLRVVKDCYPDSMSVSSNFFPEAKEGEVDLFLRNDFGNIPFANWLIKPTFDGSTVTLMRSTRYKGFEAALPEWIEGNSRQCPLGTRFEPRPPGSELNQNNMPMR